MRRWWIGVLFGIGCGAASPPGDVPQPLDENRRLLDPVVDRFIAATARGDVAAVRAMLRPSLTFGGMWFPDAACRTTLPSAGRVTAAGLDRLASCLAAVPLARSTRASWLPGVAVLTYEPGIEIEVAFDRFDAGAGVVWIAYVARQGSKDGLPTVTPAALEAHRTAGATTIEPQPDTRATIDRDLARDKHTRTWLKVCIDASGAVQGVHPRFATSIAAQDAAVAAARAWMFRPFLLGGQPTPVCSMVAIDYPAGSVADDNLLPVPPPERYLGALVVAPSTLESSRTSGEKNIAPVKADRIRIQKAGISRIAPTFQYCLDPSGKVDAIVVVQSSGLASYDERIASAIAGWRYKPFTIDRRPVAVCSLVTFIYRQR